MNLQMLDIWKFAKKNDYTIVTKDSDFNDLAVYKGSPPKIIWIKTGNCKVIDIENILKNNTSAIKFFLDDSSSVVLEI